MSPIWKNKSIWVVGGLVAGLTIVFALDDWLIVLLVRELGLGIASDAALLLAGVVLTASNVGLALAVYRVMQKKPMCGVEGLVGEVGRALNSFRSNGQVKVHGEIWQAHTRRPVHKGEKVRVVAVEGLSLEVTPFRSRRGDRSQTAQS